jgi:SAM-dependent methyltransferase
VAQSARALNVKLDLRVGDAAEYKFEPERVDLVVLFYHFDRNLFPRIVSALNPGGVLICKMSVRWDSDERHASVSTDPLHRNELPSLVPDMNALFSPGTTGTRTGRRRVCSTEARKIALTEQHRTVLLPEVVSLYSQKATNWFSQHAVDLETDSVAVHRAGVLVSAGICCASTFEYNRSSDMYCLYRLPLKLSESPLHVAEGGGRCHIHFS